MLSASTTARIRDRLPRLAVTALLCWGIGANTHLDAANTYAPAQNAIVPQENIADSIHVLSDRDAALYRGIFAAQKKADWGVADRLIAALGNRGLMGHVLAERYQSEEPRAADLKAWLDKYADLPEAAGLYQRAVSLARKGSRLPEPQAVAIWTGGDGYGASAGFRVAGPADRKPNSKPGPAARRLMARIAMDVRRDRPLVAENRLDKRRPGLLSAKEIADAKAVIAALFL